MIAKFTFPISIKTRNKMDGISPNDSIQLTSKIIRDESFVFIFLIIPVKSFIKVCPYRSIEIYDQSDRAKKFSKLTVSSFIVINTAIGKKLKIKSTARELRILLSNFNALLDFIMHYSFYFSNYIFSID